MSRSRNKLMMLSGGNREIMERYRSLRTQLELSTDSKGRIVAVTSPREGGGTAETTSNLAVAFAQAGRRTLLIDGDMLNPFVHILFGLPNVRGLSNIVDKVSEPQEVVHSDVIPNLSVITAGMYTVYSEERLGAFSFHSLFDQWRHEFDMVLLSVPPLLTSSNTQHLVKGIDGALLIVRSGKVDESDASRVKRLLSLLEVKPLGVALIHQRRKKWK
ncbi:CpsD/CapB family tyrosine-protein kinase [Paenibacillus xylaniclasticus]|uniref:CpsD/CapB family tyrosine-protein kinase n=1 Tax=Paenibacillus xylaniclasticus TaxID=588083 RepID=UPI000FDB376A|nr:MULTISPECIES: CpsD/CapB family tyrosine-protein kinase [Paenibacillus]GFN32779.1 polysaccharide biosynthesis tyrosine autokinase [Paenibacillus curdlanolyticus]